MILENIASSSESTDTPPTEMEKRAQFESDSVVLEFGQYQQQWELDLVEDELLCRLGLEVHATK